MKSDIWKLFNFQIVLQLQQFCAHKIMVYYRSLWCW